MTANLQPETKSPSRRALLAGAVAGLGAWAASAVGRASPVHASDPNDVVLGSSSNTATTTTKITNLTTGSLVFWAESSTGVGIQGNSGNWYGVFGGSTSGNGVGGSSNSANGVEGASQTSAGVRGSSTSNYGIFGISSASNRAGTLGWSGNNSSGVQGYSGPGPLPLATTKTGVFGFAAQDIFSSGVLGESPAGVGLRGKTTTGYAGYFEGRVYTNAFYELGEVATPAAPLSNRARLFVRDNGAGKTQLCVRFHTGVVRVLTTEP